MHAVTHGFKQAQGSMKYSAAAVHCPGVIYHTFMIQGWWLAAGLIFRYATIAGNMFQY